MLAWFWLFCNLRQFDYCHTGLLTQVLDPIEIVCFSDLKTAGFEKFYLEKNRDYMSLWCISVLPGVVASQSQNFVTRQSMWGKLYYSSSNITQLFAWSVTLWLLSGAELFTLPNYLVFVLKWLFILSDSIVLDIVEYSATWWWVLWEGGGQYGSNSIKEGNISDWMNLWTPSDSGQSKLFLAVSKESWCSYSSYDTIISPQSLLWQVVLILYTCITL